MPRAKRPSKATVPRPVIRRLTRPLLRKHRVCRGNCRAFSNQVTSLERATWQLRAPGGKADRLVVQPRNPSKRSVDFKLRARLRPTIWARKSGIIPLWVENKTCCLMQRSGSAGSVIQRRTRSRASTNLPTIPLRQQGSDGPTPLDDGHPSNRTGKSQRQRKRPSPASDRMPAPATKRRKGKNAGKGVARLAHEDK